MKQKRTKEEKKSLQPQADQLEVLDDALWKFPDITVMHAVCKIKHTLPFCLSTRNYDGFWVVAGKMLSTILAMV